MTQASKELTELDGVIPVSGLVAFQSGAVVSRTLVKKAAGTVTAFSFDTGEGLSEHTAPFDALVLGLEGEASISIEKTAHVVRAGELLRLPAGKPHGVTALAPFKMLLIMIRA